MPLLDFHPTAHGSLWVYSTTQRTPDDKPVLLGAVVSVGNPLYRNLFYPEPGVALSLAEVQELAIRMLILSAL